jgi:prolipoprotein diacylglyceryltransferase
MALYVMAYTAGRGWIEMLRIDDVELKNVFGLRFNVWTSIVLFIAAAIYFVVSSRLRPGREEEVYLPGRDPRDAGVPTGDRPSEATSDPDA